MLETIREYGLERLEESGEAEELRLRHAKFFVLVAEDARSRMRSADVISALAQDEGSLRAALSYCAGGREPELMLRLAGALSGYWNGRDQFEEGRRWLDEAVNHGRGSSDVRAQALRGLAMMNAAFRKYDRAQTLLGDALALYRQLGDEEGVAKCLNNLGVLVWESEDDLVRATTLFEESVALWKGLAERRAVSGVAVSLVNLAQIAEVRGNFAEGRRLAEESLAAARVNGEDVSVAEALEELAWLAVFEGRYEVASQHAAEALQTVLPFSVPGDADSTLLAALVHASHGEGEDAIRLVGAALRQYERLGVAGLRPRTLWSPRFAWFERNIGQERYAILCAEGAALVTDDVWEFVVRALD